MQEECRQKIGENHTGKINYRTLDELGCSQKMDQINTCLDLKVLIYPQTGPG